VTYSPAAEGLRLSVKDDTRLYNQSTEFRDAADVSIVVDQAKSFADLSAAPSSFDFLKTDGNSVYVLPQSQAADLPWPGWSTERLAASLPADAQLPASGQPVQLNIEVTGPGNVFTWQIDSFSQPVNRYIDTKDPAPDVIPVALGAHVHTNWAFTQVGDYLITVTPSATTTLGATLTGTSAVYHFHVGDATATAAPVNGTVPSVDAAPTVGATLTADPGTWTPAPDQFTYQWLANGEAIAGATEATYTPLAADEGADLAVRVTAIKSGRQAGVATSSPVSVAPAPPTVSVTIVDFPAELTAGEVYTLRAAHQPTVPGATYRWEIQTAGSSSWLTVSDAGGVVTSAEFTITAQLAWDGFKWRVAVLDADGGRLAVSAVHEMRVAVGAPATPGLHILGLAGHYHSGGAITLTAALEPDDGATATYRWSLQRADQSQPHVIATVDGPVLSLTAEQALDGATVSVERLVAGQASMAADPVVITVDDHGQPAPQIVAILGATDHVEGAALTLVAGVTPATVLEGYQWYLRAAGSDTPVAIPGATAASYSFVAAAEHDGAAFTVAVVGEDGRVAYGPSAPHVLAVTANSDPVPSDEPSVPSDEPTTSPSTSPTTGPGKPDGAPAVRTEAALAGVAEGGIVAASKTVVRGGAVTVMLGADRAGAWVAAWLFSEPTLLGGDWVQVDGAGGIVARIPADAALGAHRLAVFGADGSLVGWVTLTVISSAGGSDGLAVTGDPWLPHAAALAVLAVLAGSVLAARRRQLR
jgi:surface-anchored protein